MAMMKEQKAAIRAVAREKYEDNVLVPENGDVRQTQDGCWVRAFVWVENVYLEG